MTSECRQGPCTGRHGQEAVLGFLEEAPLGQCWEHIQNPGFPLRRAAQSWRPVHGFRVSPTKHDHRRWADQLHLLRGGGLSLCGGGSTEYLLEGSEVAAGGLSHTKRLPPLSCLWRSLTSLSLSNLHGFAYIVAWSPVCF